VKPVFPYPTLFGDIGLEILAVQVDGADLPYARISRSERTVALHESGREQWDKAVIRVRANLPADEIAGGPWTDLRCVVVLSEGATNVRTTAWLSRADAGGWQGSIAMARARHVNRATVGLVVTGTVEGTRGRIIGSTAQDWYVDLKATAPVRQRDIEIEEVDFREGPYEWLRPFKESPWIVETARDIPKVYLNTSAVEGLVELLNGSGGTAAEKSLREVTASQIAQDAWTAMFQTAVSDLDADEDGTPLMPGGWRESVLRMMLPDVLPDRQLTDALYEINEARIKGAGWAELQTTIQYAVGRRSQISRRLTSAVRTIDRADGSGL